MQGTTLTFWLSAIAIAVTLFGPASHAAAQQEAVIYSIVPNNGDLGNGPYCGLVFDAAGNLYGTTNQQGEFSNGTVFEVSPTGGGSWTLRFLHSFQENGVDGYSPFAGVILDSAGNLYGTTSAGGANNEGIVFELTPQTGGNWAENVLISFVANPPGGLGPNGGLVFDASGNLYGTTLGGGSHQLGTAFKLKPSGAGWTEEVLHSFGDNLMDGRFPYAGTVMDARGNLYGTTAGGGAHKGGIVFELSRRPGGGWDEKILYSFNREGKGGYYPHAGVILDKSGNLYGTTSQQGTQGGSGTVYELVPNADGSWTERVLHEFSNNGVDGSEPYAGLTFDAAGNLYGTTTHGGTYGGGTVFELSPKAQGGYAEKILHSFGNTNDGYLPYYGSLLLDAAGNLYGTTVEGGAYGGGTVFQIRP